MNFTSPYLLNINLEWKVDPFDIFFTFYPGYLGKLQYNKKCIVGNLVGMKVPKEYRHTGEGG